MGTTIGKITGRRGDACAGEIEDILARARRTLSDVSAFLELEIDQLMESEFDPDDSDRLKALQSLIQQNQQAMLKVLDIRAKLAREADARAGQALDLEDARAEIERRLACLAA
ncbi:MAG: hypothetical protein AAGC57_06295 [Pseudomonadota bacterium]